MACITAGRAPLSRLLLRRNRYSAVQKDFASDLRLSERGYIHAIRQQMAEAPTTDQLTERPTRGTHRLTRPATHIDGWRGDPYRGEGVREQGGQCNLCL